MSGHVSRRDVLRASGLTAATALGGCLLENQETEAGHLYVENTSGEERRVALLVVPEGEDAEAAAVDGWYRVPDSHALEFEGVIEPDQAYSVRAALPDAPPEDRVAVTVDPCEDGGDRIVSVRTRPDGVGVIPFGCEESYTERELEYVDASDYRDGDVEGTVATQSE